MREKDIKTKKPWRRITPNGYLSNGEFNYLDEPSVTDENIMFKTLTQADFLREYYPSGHKINDPTVYPDIYKEDKVPVLDSEGNETGEYKRQIYKEAVPRYAFAFQQIITIKQVVHLCGNDIQFELNTSSPSEGVIQDFKTFKEGWLAKDMEVAFYEAVKSVKITGDAAIIGYLDNGKFGYRTISFLDDSTLYPHYNSITGKMELFARSYYDYDDNGDAITEWLEIWDETNLSRYKRSTGKSKGGLAKILNLFNLSGYTLVSKKPHGFPSIPVAYKRDNNGPCWSGSQNSIDGYELTFSQMAHNNQAFGEPILYLQGESIDMIHDMNGSLKILSMGVDDKAGYLESQSASESFIKQLDTLYKMINEQSFTVIPPELRSGDLPAAALKILYSPAYEKAACDANEYQNFLNELVEIFSFGYGVEVEKSVDFKNLPIKWWIKPYIHLNESAIVTDLATAVQNGFVSKETASERISFYSTAGEWDRIMKEYKEQQSADLLYEEQLINSKKQEQSQIKESESDE